ncbi:unnamed protein product [Ambrosiozyma monospora]|uniref:Unnamed protein product n=1 Tax=Ambrosiozyma monospora TaxID=43982 RepID=A0ACB5TT07_AMBMO|nr:unnamed protein product [Ambrosiozyma monospora]
MKVITSAKLANSLKKKRRTDFNDPLYIPTSFKDSMKNEEFSKAIRKEKSQFTDLSVYEQYYSKTRKGYTPINEQEKTDIVKQTKQKQRNRKRNLQKKGKKIFSI